MTDAERWQRHAVRGGYIELDTGLWVRLGAIHAIRAVPTPETDVTVPYPTRPARAPSGFERSAYEAGCRSYVHWRAAGDDVGSLCYLTPDELIDAIDQDRKEHGA